MADTTSKKKPAKDVPYNSDAERVLLGFTMTREDALFKIASEVDEDSFFEGRHKMIYRVVRTLMDRKIPVDILTVSQELVNIKELENVGGVQYLKECTDTSIAFASLDFYINIVRDNACLRKMLITIRDIDNKYRTEEIDDLNSFIQESQSSFTDAVKTRRISSFKEISLVAEEIKYSLESGYASSKGDVNGLSTGFEKLNNLTQGFQQSGLYVVAARPSVGKTAIALNFAYRAATRSGVPVAIFSLEMPAEQLVKRLIAAESSVNLKEIMSGNVFDKNREKVAEAIRHLSTAPIFIDDSSNSTVLDVQAKCHKLQAEHPDLGLVIVDYIGLLSSGSKSRGPDNRQEEVRKISLALKGLARDLKVPVVAVCQLSREVEKRPGQRPMMSDLRESGAIEQDADCVMLLFREDYYGKKGDQNVMAAGNKKGADLTGAETQALSRNQQEKQLASQIPGDASYVEVIVAKNRNGQTGTVGLFFYKAYGRFDQPSNEWENAMRDLKTHDMD